ncbi:unnamed protein product, partial [Darwinula stevensoni]
RSDMKRKQGTLLSFGFERQNSNSRIEDLKSTPDSSIILTEPDYPPKRIKISEADIEIALSDVTMWRDSSSANSAFSLINSLQTFDFIIALYTLADVLTITLPIARSIQAEDMDLVSAFEQLDALRATLGTWRQEAETAFSKIFLEAAEKAELLGIVVKLPRTSQQTKRFDAPSACPEEYYRRALFIPFLDDILMDLSSRFVILFFTFHEYRPDFPGVSFQQLKDSFWCGALLMSMDEQRGRVPELLRRVVIADLLSPLHALTSALQPVRLEPPAGQQGRDRLEPSAGQHVACRVTQPDPHSRKNRNRRRNLLPPPERQRHNDARRHDGPPRPGLPRQDPALPPGSRVSAQRGGARQPEVVRREYLGEGEKALEAFRSHLNSTDSWTLEVEYPEDEITVRSQFQPHLGIYFIYTEVGRRLSAVLNYDFEWAFWNTWAPAGQNHEWYKDFSQNEFVQSISKECRIIRETTKPMFGGLIAARDFVSIVCHRKIGDTIYWPFSNVTWPGLPPRHGIVRSVEHLGSGHAFSKHKENKKKCIFRWVNGMDFRVPFVPIGIIKGFALTNHKKFVLALRNHLDAAAASACNAIAPSDSSENIGIISKENIGSPDPNEAFPFVLMCSQVSKPSNSSVSKPVLQIITYSRSIYWHT